MRIYLDDERPTPEGWLSARWPEDVIAYLSEGGVEEISLDHDLGDDAHGTGYDVLRWIEEAVALEGFKPPVIHIHTANPAARKRMQVALNSIVRMSESV
jgi:hypothetical protein